MPATVVVAATPVAVAMVAVVVAPVPLVLRRLLRPSVLLGTVGVAIASVMPASVAAVAPVVVVIAATAVVVVIAVVAGRRPDRRRRRRGRCDRRWLRGRRLGRRRLRGGRLRLRPRLPRSGPRLGRTSLPGPRGRRSLRTLGLRCRRGGPPRRLGEANSDRTATSGPPGPCGWSGSRRAPPPRRRDRPRSSSSGLDRIVDERHADLFHHGRQDGDRLRGDRGLADLDPQPR